LAGISSEQTKFCYVISQLGCRYASEVEVIITSPPKSGPYTTLRTELVRRLSPSKEHRIRELLTLEDMGDRKPSQFPRHLRSLASDMLDDLLRSIWSSRLPSHIRAVLGGQPQGDLDTADRCADRIIEAASQPTLARVAPLHENNAPRQYVENLRRQVEALSAELDHIRSNSRAHRSSSRNRRSDSRSHSRDNVTPNLCWYHHRYEARAQKYTVLLLPLAGKLTPRKSTAAHVCTLTTGSLYITDKFSKRRFLVDTGSDLCVYPSRIIPRR
jgi:hypothetical protein